MLTFSCRRSYCGCVRQPANKDISLRGDGQRLSPDANLSRSNAFGRFAWRRFFKFLRNRGDCFPVFWSTGDRSDGFFLFRVVPPPGQRIRRARGPSAPIQINALHRLLNTRDRTAIVFCLHRGLAFNRQAGPDDPPDYITLFPWTP
jgi:hypothetical protein